MSPLLPLPVVSFGLGYPLAGPWAIGGWVVVWIAYNVVLSRDARRASTRKVATKAITHGVQNGTDVLRVSYSRRAVQLREAGSALLTIYLLHLGLGAALQGLWVVVVGIIPVVLAVGGRTVARYVSADRIGELTLSPDVIRFRADRVDFAITWANLTVVLAHEGFALMLLGSRRTLYLVAMHASDLPLPPLRFSRWLPGPAIGLQCEMFDFDPVLIYWLLRFYHVNDVARPELGTSTALERTRSRAFPDISLT